MKDKRLIILKIRHSLYKFIRSSIPDVDSYIEKEIYDVVKDRVIIRMSRIIDDDLIMRYGVEEFDSYGRRLGCII